MRKVTKNKTPFWLLPKVQNPAHSDYRPASEDLPIPPLCWVYNIDAYNEALELQRKAEKNTAKLSENIHPNQK